MLSSLGKMQPFLSETPLISWVAIPLVGAPPRHFGWFLRRLSIYIIMSLILSVTVWVILWGKMLQLGFPCGSAGKESTCNAGDPSLIPGLGRSPGKGNGYPLQYSGLENPYGQKSLVGYIPWGHKELDLTGRLSTAQHNWITLLYIWN